MLNQQQTIEEIMACSSLQAAVIEYLLRVPFPVFPEKDYWVFTNEIGSHLDKRMNLASDIDIFEKSVLKTTKINKHFTDVPPKIVPYLL